MPYDRPLSIREISTHPEKVTSAVPGFSGANMTFIGRGDVGCNRRHMNLVHCGCDGMQAQSILRCSPGAAGRSRQATSVHHSRQPKNAPCSDCCCSYCLCYGRQLRVPTGSNRHTGPLCAAPTPPYLPSPPGRVRQEGGNGEAGAEHTPAAPAWVPRTRPYDDVWHYI